MTFTENLEKAKTGDKQAYGLMCNLSADTLYGIAYLSLADENDACEAVGNAYEDGFGGINRINDENHLRAWLARELTKHIVAKLKEYRAEGKSVKSDGSHEKDIFCRLGDLDRLVAALAMGFGYTEKEITVITGLKEETVERKMRDSDKKLGSDKAAAEEFFRNVKAPDSLVTKAPAVNDLTVEIDKTDDDGLIGEMERIAAIAEAEENGTQPVKPAESKPKLIRFEPEQYVEKSESTLVIEDDDDSGAINPDVLTAPKIAKLLLEEELPPKKHHTEKLVSMDTGEIDTAKQDKVTEEKTVVLPEKKAEEPAAAPKEVIPEEPKPVTVERKPDTVTEKITEPPKEIDARTFINVITSQKIKGRDFLKLMGNTRISNEVYREIEQNPNLTKERLVELLEKSSLTSADYYKVLTAVKQRNELLAKKEQANVLFDIKSRKEEKAEPSATDTRSFTAPIKEEAEAESVKTAKEAPEEENTVEEKPVVLTAPPAPQRKPEPEIKPFMPVQDVEPEDEDDEDLELDDAPSSAEKTPAPVKEQTFREKYKGKEFFIDDDVYYQGVNNGKLIFAAVCAVLLFAGSFGIRYLTTGSLLPGEEKEPVVIIESLPETYQSDEDIYKAITLTDNVVTNRTSAYYKSDSKGYNEFLTKDFCETEQLIYIADGEEIIAYSLDASAPAELYRIDAGAESEDFLGFTAINDKLYILYESDYDYPVSYTITSADEEGNPVTADYEAVISRDCVDVELYINGVYSTTYTQDGNFSALRVTDEAVSLATTLNTAGNAVSNVPETYMPSYVYGEESRNFIDYSSVTVPEKTGYNGFTVIGTVSGNDARACAVLGGSQSFTEFGDDTCRILVSDKNRTHELDFRFVGSNLTLDSTSTYEGECFGPQFIGEDTAVTYDSVKNAINVITESGATSFDMAEGEQLSAAAFDGNLIHIVTEMAEGTMLYCVNTVDLQTPAEAKPEAVYSERLKAYGENELLGLTVEADESGNRTGLRLSVYTYDGKLSEKRSTVITLDEQTSEEYLRYLSADAESSNLRIAADNGYIAVSTVYFDGISEIERILCFKDEVTALTKTTDLLLFDIHSDYRFLTFRDNVLFVITDSRIITIDPESGKALGYFIFDEQQSAAEAAPEAEESTEEAEEESTIE